MPNIKDIKVGFEYNAIDRILWFYINDDVVFHKFFHNKGENKTAKLLTILFKKKILTKLDVVHILGKDNNSPITLKLKKAFHPIPWKKAALFVTMLKNGDVALKQYISLDEFLVPGENVKLFFNRKKKFDIQEKYIRDIVFDIKPNGECVQHKLVTNLTCDNEGEWTIENGYIEKGNLQHYKILTGEPIYMTTITYLTPLHDVPLSDNTVSTST